MKLKYIKGGTVLTVFCLLAAIGCAVGAINNADYSAGKKALSFVFAVVFLLIGAIPVLYRQKYWKSISSVKIVSVDEKTSAGSAIARGVVGEMVGGTAGAVVGASTAKKDKKTTFLITFQNGKQKTKVVPNDALDYKRYMKLISG